MTTVSGGESGALTAMLVYRRPAERRDLLRNLADLGVFVVEHHRRDGWASVASSTAADVAIVLAGDDDDRNLVANLAGHNERPVIVCVPEGASTHGYLEAGAMGCVSERDFSKAGTRLMLEAGVRARRLRTIAPAAAALLLNGIEFDPRVPAILHAGAARTLSQSERSLLMRLVEAAGRPVAVDELERMATPPGEAMQRGFIKAAVLRLRRKIVELGGDPTLIRTVRGYGYALALDDAAP